MKRRTRGMAVLALGAWCLVGAPFGAGTQSACAQGLIWSLPDDGAWVRYEGTYKQVELRPGSVEGNIEPEPWIRKLWIKSVGRETAEYHGQTVPCRWIEIKVVTGRPQEGAIDSGPAGTRIYKVLVPELEITGQLADARGIPVSFLPIVKGYRKFGESEVEAISADVLQVYPLISLVMHYKTLEPEGTAEDPRIPLGPLSATRQRGAWQMESPVSRTKNEATLWRSVDVPFGLAKWSVKLSREAKDSLDPRSAFQPVTEVTVEMSAHETGNNALSELAVP